MKTKIIHYCWFGKNPKPDIVNKCMESWKKFAPDFELKEWNEENFDINICQYVQEAYEAKKWAFVSDYARFWILYNYGGIYLDTDVELIKSIEGLPDAFVGFEQETLVNSGLIRGANKDDLICKLMLDSYTNDNFIKKDGALNLKTVCERESQILENLGLKRNNKKQEIEKTIIFPTDYFAPKDYFTGEIKITKNTCSIHHYEASWHSEKEKYAFKIQKKMSKVFVPRVASIIGTSVSIIKYEGIKSFFKWVFKCRKK